MVTLLKNKFRFELQLVNLILVLSRFVYDFEVEELCMTGHESLDGPEFVKPIMPPMKDHPGLKVTKSQKLFSFSSHLQNITFKDQLSNTVPDCASTFCIS